MEEEKSKQNLRLWMDTIARVHVEAETLFKKKRKILNAINLVHAQLQKIGRHQNLPQHQSLSIILFWTDLMAKLASLTIIFFYSAIYTST